MTPGRRTNRKNLRNCQRTIVLYTFYFLGQSKKQKSKWFEFNRVQRIHRGVQREWCTREFADSHQTHAVRGFLRFHAAFSQCSRALPLARSHSHCENLTRILAGSGIWQAQEHRSAFSVRKSAAPKALLSLARKDERSSRFTNRQQLHQHATPREKRCRKDPTIRNRCK